MRSTSPRIVCRTIILGALALGAVSIDPTPAAAPPERFNYQGVLRDASDHPRNGSFDMVFRIWTAPTAGDEVLVDSHLAAGAGAVVITGGMFNVAVGSGIMTDGSGPGTYTSVGSAFRDYSSLYLEVSVSGETLLPRVPVNSVPYALHALSLNGMDAAHFLDVSPTPQLKAGPLTLGGALTVSPSPTTATALVVTSGNVGIGTTAPASRLDVSGGSIRTDAPLLVTVAAGTPPMTVSSTALVANLNADLLDGLNAGDFAQAAHNHDQAYVNTTGDTMTGPLFLPDNGLRVGTLLPQIVVSAGNVGIGTNNPNFNLQAEGNSGSFFKNSETNARAYVAGGSGVYRGWGVEAYGFYNPGFGRGGGGIFTDTSTGNFAVVGQNFSKIIGTGSMSFVQNHPYEKDKVIVYAAPEGDETAVYTRGTARLVNGEARVVLGETLQWVANPDIGLTAYVTPRGEAVPLAVVSVTPRELVVRAPSGGPRNVLFDYIVYGLRIGFEETSVVAEKKKEAYIPSMVNQRARDAERPELRAFNALERFKAAETSAKGIDVSALDLSRAAALRDSIGVFDPAVHRPMDGETPLPALDQPGLNASRPAAVAAAAADTNAGSAGRPASSSSIWTTTPIDESRGAEPDAYTRSVRPSVPDLAGFVAVSEAVGAGDVLVADRHNPGVMKLAVSSADPAVVGIVSGEPGVALDARFQSTKAPVAFTGIVTCKVDASYGAIQVGDLLTTSPTRGHAMRADNPSPGTILGKALEPLPSGSGLIKVLVMLR